MTGWEHNDVAINPVNWRTDATPATLITEPSPLIPLDEQRKDTLTVTLDKPSGLLFVKGYSATDYIIPLIGKEGCYHSREIWLYRDQLRDNIALRTARYLNNTTKVIHHFLIGNYPHVFIIREAARCPFHCIFKDIMMRLSAKTTIFATN